MSFRSFFCIAFLLATLQVCNAFSNCPLLGAVYPKPQNLTNSSIMQAAFANLTSTLSALDTAAEGQQNSYAFEIFSASDPNSVYTRYHTAPNLPSFNSTGVKTVDGDSVFRLGSLTKIFTVLTWLIEDGDVHWNSPITEFVPELKAIQANRTGDATTKVSWDEITVGALASHMAGIASDDSVMGELTQSIPNINDLIAMGFPPIPKSEIPQCGTWPECDRAQFFSTFSNLEPAFAPFATPAYSNVAFQILSYALEEITGKNFEDMLTDDIIKKLGMDHTFYNAPDETMGIIPGTAASTNWYYSLGEENPAGNMYSTSSDIAKLGRAILGYQLLSGPQTRSWMKPMELDSDINAAIGAPWGVRRVSLNQKYRIVDAYDKGGQISSWTSFMINVPDYDVGCIILIAGNDLNGLQIEFADAFGDIIIPALEATAKDQAGKLYAGTYAATASAFSSVDEFNSIVGRAVEPTPPVPASDDNFLPLNATLNGAAAAVNATNHTISSPSATLNSSLTIVTDDRPGLSITHWISNGTDMRLTVAQLMTNYSDPYWVDLSIRLYPTDLIVTSDGSRKQSFKAVFENLNAALVDKSFSTGCATWIGPTAYVYGALALDQFFFIVDASGGVTVQPQALRVSLKKATTSSSTKREADASVR